MVQLLSLHLHYDKTKKRDRLTSITQNFFILLHQTVPQPRYAYLVLDHVEIYFLEKQSESKSTHFMMTQDARVSSRQCFHGFVGKVL